MWDFSVMPASLNQYSLPRGKYARQSWLQQFFSRDTIPLSFYFSNSNVQQRIMIVQGLARAA